MRRTLNIHRAGGFITSRVYRQSKARGLSSRRLRAVALVERIRKLHAENYGVYGVRKMWHTLARQGIDIGVSKPPFDATGWRSGKPKGRAPITTRKPKGPDNRPDLVNRDFTAHRPNQLWVGRYYLCANPEKALCTPLSSRMCFLAALLAGPCPIRCALRLCLCRH